MLPACAGGDRSIKEKVDLSMGASRVCGGDPIPGVSIVKNAKCFPLMLDWWIYIDDYLQCICWWYWCVAVNECPILRFHWKCSINYLQKTRKVIHLFLCYGVMAESADASDLKSGDGNIVWVQVPLAPSLKSP